MQKLLYSSLGAVIVLGGLVVGGSLAQAYRGDASAQGPNYSPERHEAMVQAFESNDYNAWKEQMAGRGRVTEVITQENFGTFAEAHRLMLEGKTQEAAALRAELGLGQGERRGLGQGQRMGGHAGCPFYSAE